MSFIKKEIEGLKRVGEAMAFSLKIIASTVGTILLIIGSLKMLAWIIN